MGNRAMGLASLLGAAVLMGGAIRSEETAAPKPAVPPVNKECKIEDCGTPLKEMKLQASTVYKHPDTGKLHLFLEYGANNGFGMGEKPGDDVLHHLIDVDLDSGEIRRTRGGNGAESTQHFFHPNGKMYLFTNKYSRLAEYDTRTGEHKDLGKMDGTAYKTVLAPSGRIYSGEVNGSAMMYDPAAGKMTPYHQPCGRQIHWGVYTMEVEEPWIYCGMTNEGNWFLTIVDTRTGKSTTHFDVEKGMPKCGGGVERSEAGNIFYGPYLLKDGQIQGATDDVGDPVMEKDGKPKPAPLNPPDKSKRLEGNRLWPNMWRVSGYASSLYKDAEEGVGLEFDVSKAEPNSFNDGVGTIRWRKKGEGDWKTIEMKGMEPVGRTPNFLAAMADGKLLGVSGYGAAFRFDPATGKSEEIGDPPGSVYQIMPFQDKVYFCGYTAFMAEYDPGQPYAISKDKEASFEKDTNPKRYRTNSKWTASMEAGTDGRIYLGGYDGRHQTGGGLSIFDPKTKTMENIREPYFVSLGIKDLCLVNGGKTLAITTAPVGQKQNLSPELKGTIFLYDFAERKVVKRIKLDFKANPDQMFVAGDNIAIGVSREAGKDDKGQPANFTLVYGVDLESGKTLFEKRHSGRAFNGLLSNDHTPLVRGPDGCGWLFVDEWLCRILPDGELEKVRSMPEQRGKMFFLGKTLYVYNGGRIYYRKFSNVVRIGNLFQE